MSNTGAHLLRDQISLHASVRSELIITANNVKSYPSTPSPPSILLLYNLLDRVELRSDQRI